MFSNIKLRFLKIVLINVNLTACANFLGLYYMVLVHNKIQISISVSVWIIKAVLWDVLLMGLNIFCSPGKAVPWLCNVDHVCSWLFSPGSVSIYLVSAFPLANTIPIGHRTTVAARPSLFGPGLAWVNSQVTHTDRCTKMHRFVALGESYNTYPL